MKPELLAEPLTLMPNSTYVDLQVRMGRPSMVYEEDTGVDMEEQRMAPEYDDFQGA